MAGSFFLADHMKNIDRRRAAFKGQNADKRAYLAEFGRQKIAK
jgi:hypothetical protein